MRTDNIQQQLQDGKKALDTEAYSDAFLCLLPCAEAGNAESQEIVGTLYFLGVGVDRDLQKAIDWLRKAIAQGRGLAAHNLATLYLSCDPQNPEEAATLYLQARELRCVVAQDEWYDQMQNKPGK